MIVQKGLSVTAAHLVYFTLVYFLTSRNSESSRNVLTPLLCSALASESSVARIRICVALHAVCILRHSFITYQYHYSCTITMKKEMADAKNVKNMKENTLKTSNGNNRLNVIYANFYQFL